MKKKVLIISLMALCLSAIFVSTTLRPNLSSVMKNDVEALSEWNNDIWQLVVVDQAEPEKFIVHPGNEAGTSIEITVPLVIGGVPIPISVSCTIPSRRKIWCCQSSWHQCRPLAPDMDPAACKEYSRGYPFWW